MFDYQNVRGWENMKQWKALLYYEELTSTSASVVHDTEAANAQPGPIFQSVTTGLQHVEAAGHTPLPPLQCCKPPGQDTKYQAETEPSAIVNSPGMPWAECAKFHTT